MRIDSIRYPLLQAIAARPRLTDLAFTFDKWGNPLGDEFARDPTSAIIAMHEEGPVCYRTLYRHWIVCGYDEAQQVLSADELLVGTPINVLLGVRPYSELSLLAKWTFRNLILVSDPPNHTRLRRLVHKEFTKRHVRRLETHIEDVARDLLTELVSRSDPDLARDFTTPMANAGVASLIGIPRQDWPWSQRMTNDVVKLLDPLVRFDPTSISRTVDELFDYFNALADMRKADPKDDFLTAMVCGEDQPRALSRKEIVTMAIMMLGAGSQTTGGLLGNSILALTQFPHQQELLRGSPDIWPNAIEEFCRYDTSVKFAPRYTTKDFKLGGKRIPAGQSIMVHLAAANRDPRRYHEPNTLKLDREDPQPLTFGHGMHFCLGAALTRLELEVGLRTFLDFFSAFDVRKSDVSWRKSLLLRGATRMPFSGTPSAMHACQTRHR